MRRSERSDTELVLAARGDDGEAFGELFDRWFNSAWNVARTIVRQDDLAADVAQDALLAAWQRLGTLDNPDAFGGWLLRITRNRALNRLEREQRSKATGDDVVSGLRDRGLPDPTGAEPPLAPDSISEVRDRQELVWAAAAALGEREVSLLDLHLRHGMSPAEIADELGVEANNAHQQLYRLRTRLGDAIGSYLLWRNGRPLCDGLAAAVSGDVAFDRSVSRAVARHQKVCDHCSERRASLVDPGKLFAGAPLVLVPAQLKTQAAAALQSAGVPIDGSGGASAASEAGATDPTSGSGSGGGHGNGGGSGTGPDGHRGLDGAAGQGQPGADGAGSSQSPGPPGQQGQQGQQGQVGQTGPEGGPGNGAGGEGTPQGGAGHAGQPGAGGGSGPTVGAVYEPTVALAAEQSPSAGPLETATDSTAKATMVKVKLGMVAAGSAALVGLAILLGSTLLGDDDPGTAVAAIGSEADEDAVAGPSAGSGEGGGGNVGQLSSGGSGGQLPGDDENEGIGGDDGDGQEDSSTTAAPGSSSTDQPGSNTDAPTTTGSASTASTTAVPETTTTTAPTTTTRPATTTTRPQTTTTAISTTTSTTRLTTTTTPRTTTTASTTTTTAPPPPDPVVIVRFSSRRPSGVLLCADPDQAPFEALWATEGAESVTLTMPNGTHRGPPSGSYRFCAASGNTIRLLAVGPGGEDKATTVL